MGYDESRLGGIIERIGDAEYLMRYYFRGEQPPSGKDWINAYRRDVMYLREQLKKTRVLLQEVRGCDLTDPNNPLNKKIDAATLRRIPPHWHPPEENLGPTNDPCHNTVKGNGDLRKGE